MRRNLHFAMLVDGTFPKQALIGLQVAAGLYFKELWGEKGFAAEGCAAPRKLQETQGKDALEDWSDKWRGKLESVVDRCLGEGGMQWRSSGRSRP